MKKTTALFALMATCFVSACSSGGGGNGDPAVTSGEKGEQRTVLVKPTGTLADLNTPEGVAKLLQTINEQKNLEAGTCSVGQARSGCFRDLPAGTVLGSVKQSYSSYAAIRGTYHDSDTTPNEPINSYVALVNEPTTDRTAVVDATYRGKVSYSRQNQGNIVTRDSLVMTVRNNQISGNITMTAMTGKTTEVLAFKPSNIVAENNQITFSGDATFNKSFFYSDTLTETYDDTPIQGTYNGIFAGSKAEEVVGTFHSNNTERVNSVQGAFAAKK